MTRLSATAKAQHVPLGKALQEYAGAKNRARLLSLLMPVQRAGKPIRSLQACCRHPRVVGNLDIDRQGRELGAAVHADLDLVRIDRDMPPDDRENFLVQHRD
jgi:hypothetical protein